jgi:hypothetical protein
MTLGNMRANGVRALAVWCLGRGCDHHRVIEVERYGDDVPVPWLGPRLRCERCGHLGADARPDWNEANSRDRLGYHGGAGTVGRQSYGDHYSTAPTRQNYRGSTKRGMNLPQWLR